MKFDRLTTALVAALFVSLTANLFLGGIVAGKWMARDLQPGGEHAKANVRKHLSEKDEAILKEAMRDNQKKFEEMRKDLSDIRQDVKAAMHAVPFDQEALDNALREEREKKAEILQLMQASRKEVMDKLSPEGVAALQRMAPPPRFSVRRSWKPGDDGPMLWEEEYEEF